MKKRAKKIVFTGCVGAGKSTAIRTISESDPLSTEVKSTEKRILQQKPTTTVVMDYGDFILNNGQKIFLYGTPGQRRFDFMSPILTEGASGLIILIN